MIYLPPSFHNGFAPRDLAPRYQSLSNGRVAAWCPSLGPTGGVLRDWSGRGLHGTLSAGFTLSSAWVISDRWCLEFDGTDDIITVAHNAALSLTTMTIAYWIRRAANLESGDIILAKGGYNYFGSFENSFPTFYMSGLAPNQLMFTTAITVAEWTHVAMTYDGITRFGYVNGKQAATDSPTGTPTTNTSQLEIGSSDGGQFVLPAKVDDIVLWNRALAPSEITLLSSRRGIAYEPQPRFPPTMPRGAAIGGSVFSSPVITP